MRRASARTLTARALSSDQRPSKWCFHGVTAFLAVALDKAMSREKATEHAPDVAPRRLRDLHPLDALTVLLANFKVRKFRRCIACCR